MLLKKNYLICCLLCIFAKIKSVGFYIVAMFFERKRSDMKTIIHIGQHKTGTTSLQTYLRGHSRQFNDCGFYFHHELAGYEDVSQYMLNVYALDDNRFSPMKDKLTQAGVLGSLESVEKSLNCLLYTSPSPRDLSTSRMPSSA